MYRCVKFLQDLDLKILRLVGSIWGGGLIGKPGFHASPIASARIDGLLMAGLFRECLDAKTGEKPNGELRGGTYRCFSDYNTGVDVWRLESVMH